MIKRTSMGWIGVYEDGSKVTTGGWSTTTKIYLSEKKAISSIKQSYPLNEFKVVEVFADLEE